MVENNSLEEREPIVYKIIFQEGFNSQVFLFPNRRSYEQHWAYYVRLFQSMKENKNFRIILKAYIYKKKEWHLIHLL